MRNLIDTVTIKPAAIYNSKNIYQEIMNFIIEKESPSSEDCKSRGGKCSILKPMSPGTINPIFVKIGVTQFS